MEVKSNKQINENTLISLPQESIEKLLKQLIVSLAWKPHSYYHSCCVYDSLIRLCPEVNFDEELNMFEKIINSKPGKGSPK